MSKVPVQSGILPSGRLIGAAVGICVVLGLGWWGIAGVLGAEPIHGRSGLLAASVVGLSAMIGLLVIRPWKRRSLMDWPFVWLAGSGVRMALTLGLTLLLYFALSPLPATFGVAVAVTYLVTLLGETWMYVHEMKILPPLEHGAMPQHDGGVKPGVARP